MTDEEFYDTEVAPVLMDLARKHQERGLGFLALAQWDKSGKVSRTATLPVGAPASLRWGLSLASASTDAGVNIDGFMIAVMKEARETGHSSMILKQLGVPLKPAAGLGDRPMSDAAKIPTSHDIARQLLSLPDLPLITNDDWCNVRLVSATEDGAVEWFISGEFITGPAVVLGPPNGEGYGQPPGRR